MASPDAVFKAALEHYVFLLSQKGVDRYFALVRAIGVINEVRKDA